MKKNDITYEYRVFTHRPIDVESMEVGRCTSKVVKELKEKDKVDGRFFHTTDTDEWFFCWNGGLQKLNLKGSADVNSALEEVNRLIAEANTAVDGAKKTAGEAKDAATAAAIAADAATAAVESIENKADKSDVEAVSKAVESKADKSVVDELSANAALKSEIPVVPTKVSAFENDANYLTKHQDISGKQDVISDLETIRSGAAAGATALQSIPEEYITEEKLNGKSFATTEYVGQQIEKIEIPTVPTNVSAFTNDAGYLTEHQDITGKQDVIVDLDTIRSGAELGATALQAIPSEYVTETELDDKGYLTEQSLKGYATETFVSEEIGKLVIPEVPSMDEYAKKSDLDEYAKKSDIPVIPSLDDYAKKSDIPSLDGYAKTTDIPSMDNYFTKDEINTMIGDINTLIGRATALADTILNA